MDINAVLEGGWPPSELDAMPFCEYLTWYNMALETNKEREKQYKKHN